MDAPVLSRVQSVSRAAEAKTSTDVLDGVNQLSQNIKGPLTLLPQSFR